MLNDTETQVCTFKNSRKAVKLIENRDYNLQEDIPCYLLKQGELRFELSFFIPIMQKSFLLPPIFSS